MLANVIGAGAAVALRPRSTVELPANVIGFVLVVTSRPRTTAELAANVIGFVAAVTVIPVIGSVWKPSNLCVPESSVK